MIISIAGIVVFTMGAAVGALCLWGMVVPEKLIRLVRQVLGRESGIYVAVGSRLLLGVALILSAASSKFPLLFNIIGVLAIIGAAVVPFIGRARLTRIIEWFARFPPAAIRAWLLLGLAFVVFLVYGILP